MRCLTVNTFENEGGAARAAHRLHLGLKHNGLDSLMLVQAKSSDDPAVIGPEGMLAKGAGKIRPHLDKLPLRICTKYSQLCQAPWAISWVPGSASDKINGLKPDIVHLHWIGAGFISISDLTKIRSPLVWTLHDSWAFTGGCHIPFECTRYEQFCGACPQCGAAREADLSRWVWRRKAKHWQNLNLTVIAPSHWLAERAKASSLFRNTRVEVIPNGIDLNQYKPVSQAAARKLLGLPRDKKLILFGAMSSTTDHNKGFQYLRAAIRQQVESGWADRAELLVFGTSHNDGLSDLGLKVNLIGRLYDDISIALLYAAADVFVAPSIQENLPNTVMEAMACGVPCVAFEIGGLTDMITHQENGYLARPYETSDLYRGIDWIISDSARWDKLSKQARAKAERDYDIDIIAAKYIELYKDILS